MQHSPGFAEPLVAMVSLQSQGFDCSRDALPQRPQTQFNPHWRVERENRPLA